MFIYFISYVMNNFRIFLASSFLMSRAVARVKDLVLLGLQQLNLIFSFSFAVLG